MKKHLIRWIFPLVVLFVLATVLVLNVSLHMAHAASVTTSHPTQVISPTKSGGSVPNSVWHD